MPAISRLGHVGLHMRDLERAKRFYRDILGLEVTDEDSGLGVVFMSARPAEEHQELALFGSRNVGAEALVLQQALDFDQPQDEILRRMEASVRQHGATGYIDPTVVRERRVLEHAKERCG